MIVAKLFCILPDQDVVSGGKGGSSVIKSLKNNFKNLFNIMHIILMMKHPCYTKNEKRKII